MPICTHLEIANALECEYCAAYPDCPVKKHEQAENRLVVFCPTCGHQCIMGTTTVVISNPLTETKETKPTYTCPTHGGTYADIGQFIVDVDKIPE